MCGIIAYSGHQPATPLLIEGLRSLEYRGYDSAGIAFIQKHELNTIKSKGKLAELEKKLAAGAMPLLATSGIGHTRWATHGVPNETNAHPHVSNNKKFAVVHNGIIENYREIKEDLSAKGYIFYSETDTEVLVNLIQEESKSAPDTLTAFQRAVQKADGAYALVLLNVDEPGTLYATRKEAPLIAGIGVGENFVASDITAFLAYTRKVIFMNENELLRVTDHSIEVFSTATLSPKEYTVQEVEWDVQAAKKSGYKHYMLKEIFEQPAVLRSVLAGRVNLNESAVNLPELDNFIWPERVRIVACGTSYNAGLWAAPLIEQWAGIPCSVEIASEFRYRKPILTKNELVILISQSGETADTLAALKVAKGLGAPTLGLCNVMGSSIAREADRVIYTQAGPEISVASTKALCSQMALLTLIALYWGINGGNLNKDQAKAIITDFSGLAELLEKEIPQMHTNVKAIAVQAASANNIFFLGRGQNCAMAHEGALKFKELSYVHAEGYPAGEMKHGPIALIDPEFLTIALAPRDEHFSKIYSNVQEVAARSGPVIILTQEGHEDISGLGKSWYMPQVNPPFTSFVMLPMLQLLSYEAANYLGKDVDQPRNLAKSVTVE
ncbi:glutamine--fructose-6-phosphate transaminase (isomerizing) [Desulfovibrio sp. OttesenSCG-928-F07]|nr:glutamine--fructose-6-phosphate transaminase (isomerizing) [Desulfovibrio sp. OttesenSCG-928-F07]